MPRAIDRSAAAMVALLCALGAGSCTLLVNSELDRGRADAGSDGGSDSGPCSDLAIDDGFTDGGVRFHSGVLSAAFRPPGFPPANFNSDPAVSFPSVLTLRTTAGVTLIEGTPGAIGVRNDGAIPTDAVSTPGHDWGGASSNFGCAETLLGTYDGLHDRTAWSMWNGGCNDSDDHHDLGLTVGTPASAGAAAGWWGTQDGGVLALALDNQIQLCDEGAPPTCVTGGNALGPGAGARRTLDALTGVAGDRVWVVSTLPASGPGEVRLYGPNLGAAFPSAVAPFGGAVVTLAADAAMALRIAGGNLEVRAFDAAGLSLGQASLALGDAQAHGLNAARFSGTGVRLAFLGGDGRARVATLDASVAGNLHLAAAPTVVCGSDGATVAAPVSPTVAAVQVADGLYLRSVP